MGSIGSKGIKGEGNYWLFPDMEPVPMARPLCPKNRT